MRCFSGCRWALAWSILFSSTPLFAAEQKPIVAVFTVEARGIALDSSMLDRLSAYLAGSVVATGHYQVVPRDQLKKRLVQQKVSSYRSCYERSCQIEIGKELAAQKTLATQVIKLGTKCAITGTLFDLKRAAAERAATVRGGCSEDEIVGSLETMVKKLAIFERVRALGSSRAVKPQAKATGRTFAVDFRSTPRGANVFLDGRSVCVTNSRRNLPAGSHELQVERRNYLMHKQRITISGREVFDVKLKLSPAGREAMAQRTAFLTLEGMFGFIASSGGGGVVGGLMLHALTLKWRSLFWSVLEGGAFLGGDNSGGLLLSRVGYPLHYGGRGQHQLRFGLGLGAGAMGVEIGVNPDFGHMETRSSAAFMISPTAEYRFVSSSAVNVGVVLRAVLPLGGEFTNQPFAAFLSLAVGWQKPGSSI